MCKVESHAETALDKRGRCKACISIWVREWRRRKKRELVELFGGECVVCGYQKSFAALEFHHLDPKMKSFGIADAGTCRAWKRMLEEAKKCILVCANCHAEIEASKTLQDVEIGIKLDC